MRIVVAVVTLLVPAFVSPGTILAQSMPTASQKIPDEPTPSYTPLTPGQKIKRRALRLIEPVTLFSSAFSASMNQARDEPHAWGQGAQGYAIRFASAEGGTAAHNAIALGFDLTFHLDPRYRRMPEAGPKARLWNAVSQTFIANKDSGGRMVNVSEMAGNFGAGFVSNTWQPASNNTAQDAFSRGLYGLLFHTGKNVAREFLPDVLHRLHKPSPSSDPRS